MITRTVVTEVPPAGGEGSAIEAPGASIVALAARPWAVRARRAD
jgi:hypothetical protein